MTADLFDPEQEWTSGMPPEGAEGEEDLDRAGLAKLSDAVVAATDWTTETILRQLERGNIQLNPSFQRRDAWRPPRKSKFIESLILSLPIPQLVLAESKMKKGSYIVIDGKQRLLSLRQFAARTGDPVYRQLKLEGLQVRTDLVGKSLQDLEGDPSFADEVRTFQNQTIRTVVIRGWPNENVLYLIFLRLNTGSVQLSPQELRQALHPGKFIEFVDEESGQSLQLQRILHNSEPDFRMRDAELLVRYYAFRGFLHEYKGNLKAFLDSTCAQLNLAWDQHERDIKSQAADFEEAIETVYAIFGSTHAFRKWDGNEYETRFNRAVFDVMVYYFSNPRVREKALRSKSLVERGFRRLCESDQNFRKAIESTTKSLEATVGRLAAWGEVLRRKLRITGNMRIPRLVNNQIRL
jgi:Protein of unknown function DUF262